MANRLVCALLVVAVSLPASAQTPSSDPEVAKGSKQVEEGEYDAAIYTLDTAARRLAADPSKTRDLSQAYLYLGIAYFAKGHEAAAKAKFREALGQFKDLSLNAEKYPPKVLGLFEEARAEAGRSSAGAPRAASAPAEKKGGGSKILLIGAGVVAVGAGVAVAAGGGGGDTSSGDPRTETFGPVTITEANYFDVRDVFVAGNGSLEANVRWDNSGTSLKIDLYDPDVRPFGNADSDAIATSSQAGSTESRLTATVRAGAGGAPKRYQVAVTYGNTGQWGARTSATLTVTHP